MQCDLFFGFLKCALTEDTIDVDLKVHTLIGKHTIRKDYKSQMTKCIPWGNEVQLYPSSKKKMIESMRHQQIIPTPFACPVQPKPKAAVKKWNLVPLTRPTRAKLSQPRRINVGKLPEATQQNWASTIGKNLIQEAKDVAQSASTSLDPIQGSQLMDTPSMPLPHFTCSLHKHN